MEYYIFVTNDCNLACKYCSGINLNRRTSESTPRTDVRKLCNFLIGHNESSKDSHNFIVFYGGEPTLHPKIIQEIIDRTRYHGFKYALQTNGTLLHTLEKPLLDDLDFISISIDGTHLIHDKNRGRGTFQQVINNLFQIKKDFQGKTIARMTVTPENNIYESVLGVVNFFDTVFWQLENSPIITSQHEIFKQNYSQELNLLIDFWMSHLKEGIVKNILPFFAVAEPLLFEHKYNQIRCGAGTIYNEINTEGECYACDEMNKNPDAFMGTFENARPDYERFKLTEYDSLCKNCDIKYVCGGRCYRCSKFSTEKRKFYCDCTKMLVEKIRKKIPELREMLEKKQLLFTDFDVSKYFLEEIP